ncbi:MAG: hypothetical protein KJ623_02145 [Nanoarchaeota archaeon]|nr:hypothetical protein [Nanoarchaeota archaeon]MBU0962775.1 hypothetical protein [Nanoarchaeota archaeon]
MTKKFISGSSGEIFEDILSLNNDNKKDNQEISKYGERIFEEETSKLGYLTLRDTIDKYPQFFISQLEELSEEGLQFFNLGEDIGSPIAWLLLNNPRGFLFACERYKVLYKEVIDNILKDGGRLPYEAQIEISHLKDEFNSYLQDIDFNKYRKKLGGHIDSLYYQAELIRNDKEKEDYIKQNIDLLKQRYAWLLDTKENIMIKSKINEFFNELKILDKLILDKGLYEKNPF